MFSIDIRCNNDGRLSHVLYLDQGVVWTIGYGEFGQLGHGDNKGRDIPSRIESLFEKKKKVSKVACGSRHTILLTGLIE